MENNEQPDIYDLGLDADLAMLKRSPIDRRRILRMGVAGIGLLLAGAGVASAQTNGANPLYLPMMMKPGTTPTPTIGAATATATAGATATPTATATAGATATPTTGTTTCVSEIPQETAGPYPGDGSNASNGSTVNVLSNSGIVRSDIRTSTTGNKNTAPGMPFVFELTFVDSDSGCVPLAGYAVYAWHCNRDGNYSLYSNGVTNEDYLRGVQETDSTGKVTFTSIFPACYSGRWPHVHFEVYQSLAKATGSSNVIHTSQLALPEATCKEVYATSGYSASVTNLSRITLDTDNVFRDGYGLQVATVTGNTTSGYTAKLTVGVNV